MSFGNLPLLQALLCDEETVKRIVKSVIETNVPPAFAAEHEDTLKFLCSALFEAGMREGIDAIMKRQGMAYAEAVVKACTRACEGVDLRTDVADERYKAFREVAITFGEELRIDPKVLDSIFERTSSSN